MLRKKKGFFIHHEMLENLKMLGNDVVVEVLSAISKRNQGKEIDDLTPPAQFAFNEYTKILYGHKNKARNIAGYNRWVKSILGRDKHTCQICGRKGGKLNAHHIKTFAKYPELRLEVDNGITYCEECHKKLHREHGRGN